MLPTTHVSRASESDLAALATMRIALGWHPNQWLLQALHRCDCARLFVVREPEPHAGAHPARAGGILAAASAVNYGARGFIGNVMVVPAAQRRGLGRAVMRAALAWLCENGTSVVELDATPEGRPLYKQLGFRGIGNSWFLRSTVRPLHLRELERHSTTIDVDPAGPSALSAIAPLDEAAFGGDRSMLFRHILAGDAARLYVGRDAAHAVAGFLVARPFALELEDGADSSGAGHATVRLGPWVARSPGTAAALLRYALADAEAGGWIQWGRDPTVLACIAGNNVPALELARTCGLEPIEDDLRMRLVLAPISDDAVARAPETVALGRPEWLYAMTAPMVG